MKTVKILLKILSAIFALAVFAAAGAVIWYFAVTADTKFDETKLVKKTSACEVFDSDNKKIEEKTDYDYVSLEKIPEITRKAFIAVEDKRFYSHNGLDYIGIFRAAVKNVFSGKLKQGGSTISQQLVKNLFLTGDKTIERKFKEIKLTEILEKRYSKDEILELYLNSVYFGKGIKGISEAAKRYFQKDVEELTLGESALLAGIIKSPAKYNPVDNFDNSVKRKNLILKIMASEKIISQKEYENSKNSDIIINFKTNYDTRSELLSYIKAEAMDRLGLEKEEDLNGYKIYSSVNKKSLSYVGSPKDYSLSCDYTAMIVDIEKKKITSFSSSSGDLKRCPASTAKPWLVYAPAIEEKLITVATKIKDEKISYGGYSPANPDGKFHGYVNAKEALSKSYNIPAVKIADSLGMKKIKEYAKKMNVEFSNDDLSVSLGNLSGGITLTKLVSCYSPFVNGGNYNEYGIIDKIVSPKNKVVYEGNAAKEEKVFSDSTAFLVNDILKESVKSGTAKRLNFPFEICAKTGTNGSKKGNIDAYCVAYTTGHIVAVWLGNANGELMDNSVSGGNYPAAMVRDIFTNLYANSSPKDFAIPESVEIKYLSKAEYEKDQKLLLSEKEDKNSVPFYFARNNEPTEKAVTKPAEPVVKDFKITCNKGEISISVSTDENTGFYVYNDKGNNLFKSEKSGNYTFRNTLPDTEYVFYIAPFTINKNGKEIIGEKIKLPTVKTDGKNKAIQDIPWWEE